MPPVGAGGARPLLGRRTSEKPGKSSTEKPSWYCSKCREAGPQGKPDVGFPKFCHNCGISEGNCFGGNIPPERPSAPVRQGAAGNQGASQAERGGHGVPRPTGATTAMGSAMVALVVVVATVVAWVVYVVVVHHVR